MGAAKIEVDTIGRFSHSFDSYSSWKLGTYKIQVYDDEIKSEKSFEILSWIAPENNFEDDVQ